MHNLLAWCKSARLPAGAFLLAAALSGCASLVPQTMGLRTTWPSGVPVRTELAAVPFFPQQEHQCGPAALATTLVHAGVQVTPAELAAQVYLPARQGSLQIELLAAARRHGRLAYPLAPRFDDLLREVAQGNPVIVLQDTGIGPITRWHYAVVVGFDYPAGELYLRSGETRRLSIPFTVFEYTWRKSGYWAMVTLPPGRIPATAVAPAYLAALAALDRGGAPGAARAAYAAAVARWPDNLAASIGLANQHYDLGALPQAERELRRALARHPDSIAALNNLAQTLSDMGRNDEALLLVERAQRPDAHVHAATVRATHALIVQRMAASHRSTPDRCGQTSALGYVR